jgi:tellurite resistance protein
MTPAEKNIVKSLVAVAWADGTLEKPEEGSIDALLWAFGASDADEAEIREYAKKRRTLEDVQLDDLSAEEREMLLAHAALLTHADGTQSKEEQKLLATLVKRLGIEDGTAKGIIKTAKDRASKLASRL